MIISKQHVIRLNLHKQHLYHAPAPSSERDAHTLLRDLGLIQLDTLNVVTRSHNLVFHARMSDYTEEMYWNLYADKQIFEGYVHALSILPLEEFRYHRPRIEAYRRQRTEELEPGKLHFLESIYREAQKYPAVTSRHLQEIEDAGHLFDRSNAKPGDWVVTPVRWALDHLWRSGQLVQVRDRKFGKVYHVAESWFPQGEKQEAATREEMYVHAARRSLSAMGAATLGDIADYYRLSREDTGTAVRKLLDAGEVIEVDVEEEKEKYYLLATDVAALDAPALAEDPTHNALLSPFDNLIWHRPRTLRLFGVDYKLECYTPEPQRRYGYFALPILVRGRIVGTLDLKTERKARTLVVKRQVLFDPAEKESLQEDILRLLQRLGTFLQMESWQPAGAKKARKLFKK
jgi:uncharacterized protein